MGGFFGMFQLLLGVYLIYGAITGKGQLYTAQNIKKGMEEKYKKTMRIFSWVLAPLLLTQGVVDLMQGSGEAYQPALYTVSIVLWVIVMIGVIAMAVCTYRLTDRSRPAQNRNNAQPAIPRAAFEFDEPEAKSKPE